MAVTPGLGCLLFLASALVTVTVAGWLLYPLLRIIF